jgi:sialic acid synthase SpsE
MWPEHGNGFFVIAEIGLNHGGSIERALALVDAAADAGASAIKLQTLDAEALVAPTSLAPQHVQAASLVDFFRTFELDDTAHRQLIARAHARGLLAMSTPFSLDAVDRLARAGVDAFKIASGDVTYTRLIERCAATGKPMVMSTGMATTADIAYAVGRAYAAGNRTLALLHCVSAYPVPQGQEQLRSIAALADMFGVPVGLSDHGADTFAVPLAVSLGASLYERHIVLSHGDGSIDDAVSSTPAELRAAIDAAARARAALGRAAIGCGDAEAANVAPSRRSLCARRRLAAGTIVRAEDIIALRPAIGLSPTRECDLIGVRLDRQVDERTPFFESDLTSGSVSRGQCVAA